MRLAGSIALFLLALTCACDRRSVPPPNMACPAFEVAGPRLVYPIPGATGVPVTAGDLVLAGPPVGNDIEARLVAAPSGSATPIALGAFAAAPSPLPMPTATGYARATLYGVSHPALASNTTYSIDYASTSAGPCKNAPASSGSFTTASVSH